VQCTLQQHPQSHLQHAADADDKEALQQGMRAAAHELAHEALHDLLAAPALLHACVERVRSHHHHGAFARADQKVRAQECVERWCGRQCRPRLAKGDCPDWASFNVLKPCNQPQHGVEEADMAIIRAGHDEVGDC
jgi:hypothetical protein